MAACASSEHRVTVHIQDNNDANFGNFDDLRPIRDHRRKIVLTEKMAWEWFHSIRSLPGVWGGGKKKIQSSYRSKNTFSSSPNAQKRTNHNEVTIVVFGRVSRWQPWVPKSSTTAAKILEKSLSSRFWVNFLSFFKFVWNLVWGRFRWCPAKLFRRYWVFGGKGGGIGGFV